jgi:hypothetical protein
MIVGKLAEKFWLREGRRLIAPGHYQR